MVTSMGMRGGPGSNDPGQITWNGSLGSLIPIAYGVKGYEVIGPGWLSTERFTIVAKVPPGASKEQVLKMWQNLLIERFGLQAHSETKELPVYELNVAGRGMKLKESPPAPPPAAPAASAAPDRAPVRFTTGPDGCPVLADGRRGSSTKMMPAGVQICAASTGMETLVAMLSGYVDRPILDKTNLSGKYDFKLEFQPGGLRSAAVGAGGVGAGGAGANGQTAAPPADDWPTIFAALESQLGVKLNATKAATTVLVIDKIEKVPTEN